MFTKYSRLKLKRKLRKHKKLISKTAESANSHIDRNIFRRDHNWKNARRFVIGWLTLMFLLGIGVSMQIRNLGSAYLTVKPIGGGIYIEGIVGNLSNPNPLFATSSVDMAVSKLVFSSLLKYDDSNKLTGDLAKAWESDDSGRTYTITIRDDVRWHDGQKLDADDVIFTYNLIKNPAVQSTIYTSFKGVAIEKVDDTKVKFTLPNSYSPFLNLLTNGILPEHLLHDIEPSSLRSSKFNNLPIGSGPFRWLNISAVTKNDNKYESIELDKTSGYYQSDVQLDGFTIKTYPNKEELNQALKDKKIIAAAGTDYHEDAKYNTLMLNQSSALTLFLNTKKPLLNDANIRKALISATSTSQISAKLPYPTIAVDEPLLKGQLGYNSKYKQLPYNAEEANKLLTAGGWLLAENSQYRTKEGKELSINLVSENTPDYAKFAEEIQKQWLKLGIKTNVLLSEPEDLVRNTLSSKDYDALLYSINIGSDPDVYVYWHSSQAKDDAKPGLNFSRYESKVADSSLEAGRSRTAPTLRAVKYEPFLRVWHDDVPSIGIHQPVYLYTTNLKVYNLQESIINIPSDRYRNVYNWQINTHKQPY